MNHNSSLDLGHIGRGFLIAVIMVGVICTPLIETGFIIPVCETGNFYDSGLWDRYYGNTGLWYRYQDSGLCDRQCIR